MELKHSTQWKRPLLFASILFFVYNFYGATILTIWQQWRTTSSFYFDSKWQQLLRYIGDDDYYLYVWGIVLSIQIPFWSVGSMYILMDCFNWPKWVRKYKVQPGTNEPLDLNRLLQTVKVVLRNQWLIGTPLFIISYYLKKMTKTIPDVHELPTLERMLIDLAVLIVVDEIGLYYVHRLQHHPKLYAAVHKKHHEWSAPIAITFVYSTPVEYLMNAVPVTLGPLIMNPHIITLWAWYTLVHLRGLKNHSGYAFPWLPTSEEHDYHHMASTSCFGKSIYLDWLNGTDKGFRAYIARKKTIEQQKRNAQVLDNKCE